MRFFQAKSFRGMLLKVVLLTMLLHVLFAPVVNMPGLFLQKERGAYDGYIVAAHSILVVLSVPWGICFRKANQALLSSDPIKRRKYARILLVVLPVVTFLAFHVGAIELTLWLDVLLNSLLFDMENFLVTCFLYQVYAPFTIVGIAVSLATVFFYKPNKDDTVEVKRLGGDLDAAQADRNLPR